MIGGSRSNLPGGGRVRIPANPKRTKTMLRTFAVALLAASVFTAPVLAQGGGSAATPPAKVETRTDAAPKVTANPSAAKVKPAKRYTHRHAKHKHVAYVKHKHVAHVKRVKHVKSVHAVHGTKAAKPLPATSSKSTTGQNGATPAPKTKSNVN
jgi:hypothetical protein